MQKHFVTFFSPGTFIDEITTLEIDSWDVKKAIKLSESIKERHGATPYGFHFSTRGRKDDELDSKNIAVSPTYYLGGSIETLEKIKERNSPDDRILISNMECNGWNRVITNTNSWKITKPLYDTDVILDV